MKRILLALITLFYLNLSWSSPLAKAPINFNLNDKNYVFIDISKIETTLVFDFAAEEAIAESQIYFTTNQVGYPIFDLVPDTIAAELNGFPTQSQTVYAPKKETQYRSVNMSLLPGQHKMIIKNKISKNIQFKTDFVSLAFWMSDLTDRRYIEQYLPTNIEFDQYQQELEISFKNTSFKMDHEVYTNGIVSKNGDNFKIIFPDYFSPSSFYLHLTKKDRFPTEKFNFTTATGRVIPVTLYAKSTWGISGVQKKTLRYLRDLERNFGEWSHPNLVIYIAGIGGMEHAGATITSESALGHELTHSYFARSVMPISGNDGWIDEAIASWRDDGQPFHRSPNFSSSNMSSHSIYRRYTDRRAYKQGANFIGHLKYIFKKNDLSFEAFLKQLHQLYQHQNISTDTFRSELEKYSGLNFKKLFAKYILNKKNGHAQVEGENPYHPQLTDEQLMDLL